MKQNRRKKYLFEIDTDVADNKQLKTKPEMQVIPVDMDMNEVGKELYEKEPFFRIGLQNKDEVEIKIEENPDVGQYQNEVVVVVKKKRGRKLGSKDKIKRKSRNSALILA